MKKIYLSILALFVTVFSFAKIDTISVASNSYTPSSLTIDLGDTVRFVLISGTHPTESDNGMWSTFTLTSVGETQDIILNSADSYAYHCTAHGGMTGTITVLDTGVVTPTSISNQPTNTTVTEGANASFSITVVNEDSLQWQEDAGSGFSNLSGETNASLSLSAVTLSMDGNKYRCQVFGSPTITSSEVTLNVDSIPDNPSNTVFVVRIENDVYIPSTVNINVNDTVRFKWIEGVHPTESITGAFPTFDLNATDTIEDIQFTSEGTYEYFCQFHGSSDGSGMAGKIIVGNPQSINSSINNTFIISPNPVEDKITLIHNYKSLQKISILNINGKIELSFNISDFNRVNVSKLKSGMYFVNALDKEGNILKTSKIIKK